MCQKPHPEKNRFDWKSQGQIIQECQGQISQGQIFQECQGQIPRSNGKMKWETTKNRKKPVLIGKIGKMGNRKNGKV